MIAEAERLFTAALYAEEQHATRRAERAWNSYRETFTAQHGPRAWGALNTTMRERAYQNLDAERLAQSAERRTVAAQQGALTRHVRRRDTTTERP